MAHEQFAETVEPVVANLNNPAPGLLFWVAMLDVGFHSATVNVGDIAVALDGAQMLGATVARVRTPMLVSSVRWGLAFGADGTEHRLKSVVVVDVGPAHDERQRDATAVHQQMPFASFFPGPWGSGRRFLGFPAVLTRQIHGGVQREGRGLVTE